MKFSFKISILLVALAGILVIASCSKDSLNGKLQGSWKKINLANISDSTQVEYWDFQTGDNLFVYYRSSGSSGPLDTVRLKYSVNSYEKFVISSAGTDVLPQYYATWTIVKLNKNMMRIDSRDGGLIIYDFEKQ